MLNSIELNCENAALNIRNNFRTLIDSVRLQEKFPRKLVITKMPSRVKYNKNPDYYV